MKKAASVILVLSLLGFASCSQRTAGDGLGNGTEPRTPLTPPGLSGPEVGALSGSTSKVVLSNGAEIVLQKIAGQTYFEVEGTLTQASYAALSSSIAKRPQAERAEIVHREMGKILKSMQGLGALPVSEAGEVAYFTFLLPYQPELFSNLKSHEFPYRVVLNPVVYDENAIRQAKALTPAAEGLLARADGRSSLEGFSGRQRMGVADFIRQAEADIGGGAQVDGSSAKVGITDTGITYNHPAYLSRQTGLPRIYYMRDFTGEGAAYINSLARFEVTETESQDALKVSAEWIDTPPLPQLPMGDVFAKVDGLVIQVGAELKSQLLAPNASNAKLGIIREEVFQAPGEAVDINNNGKLDDKFFLLWFPATASAPERVYLDTSGTGDFRNSAAMQDWNRSGDTLGVFAERIGLSIRSAKIPATNSPAGSVVRAISLVGYDPGNHGSHVAGIVGGSSPLAKGIAPEAQLAMNRICSNRAGCSATQAMIDLVAYAKPDVINMSIGGLSPFNDGYGVQELVVNRLSSLGNVQFMISAGNSGPGRQTVGSPSTARLALSIGATASRSMVERQYQWAGLGTSPGSNEEDFMLFFSSRGPTASGGFKPNLTAPGTELSSIQLNTAPGARGGLAVFWGTSMAAPAATGAYALLIDAIHKYNAAHPEKALTTDAMTLRRVLTETARPFDVSRFDPESGTSTEGQYTWIDQGAGMIDLKSAWTRLQQLRDSDVPSSVKLDGVPVELDYSVLVSATNPNGLAYDGSRAGGGGVSPAFAEGLYIDASGSETLREVHVSRKLPEALGSGEQAGALTRELLTTSDEFVLKTVIYGSDRNWLKVGVRDELSCDSSQTAHLTVIGRGVEVEVDEQGRGRLNPFNASTLLVCLDRGMISLLPPGDHGALIAAYRTAEGRVSPVASFVIPVYLTVPHQTLADSAAYDLSSGVSSFGVGRNYVRIPEGTSVVRVRLEVPAMKGSDAGCSGVELMALEGLNTAAAFANRTEARAVNCLANGSPAPDRRRSVTLTRANPRPGIWDLHVFGLYKYAQSSYRLRVDYVTGSSSVERIQGGLGALTGSLSWTLSSASIQTGPSSVQSRFELQGLSAASVGEIQNQKTAAVPGPQGQLRVYPESVKKVSIAIGGSSGNDLDLALLECPADKPDFELSDCAVIAQSGGATDEEEVAFSPRAQKAYVALVIGYSVSGSGSYRSVEKQFLEVEPGTVAVTGPAPGFKVNYSFGELALARSQILTSELFKSGTYEAFGRLELRSSEDLVLGAVPVLISATAGQ